MRLREGEEILKVYHHHPTPFVYMILKVIAGTFPFFLLLFLMGSGISKKWYIIIHLIVICCFALMIAYVSLIYWLDKLIISNQRIVYENWIFLTIRTESEAFLHDIQDIQTKEKGFLAMFWIFDYGLFEVQTAASALTLKFDNAPDPEGIRQFIYQIKPQ